MKYTEQSKLTKKQKTAADHLLARCREAEGFVLSFPSGEPDTRFFLAEEDDLLTGMLSLSRLNDAEYEVLAFVEPDFRHQGIFTHLFRSAQHTLPGKTGGSVTLRFPTEEECISAVAVLRTLGAAPQETELELSLSFKDLPDDDEDTASFRFRKSQPSGEGIICYEALKEETEDDRPVFRAFVFPLSDHGCYLHRVATRKDLIGQGIGSQVLPQFLKVLKKGGYETVLLQVAEANVPAVRLYTGAGFGVKRKLTYYTKGF